MNRTQRCELFRDIREDQLEELYRCLSAVKRRYDKGQTVFLAGEKAALVGIVLSGGVHVVQEDFWGNRTILTHVEPGELFGEVFSCAQVERLPVSVVAAEASQVLLINYSEILRPQGVSCAFHAVLIRNMLQILAQKNLMLTRKMEHVSKRTTREKVLSYLSQQAAQSGGSRVEIPFDRQGLADYLSVDRSALSRELSQMQREGLLRYRRSRFELLTRPAGEEAGGP